MTPVRGGMRRRLSHSLFILVSLAAFLASFEYGAAANNWTPVMLVRFGNVDALDAEDGELGSFLKSIRNDGRFVPPMRSLAGAEIRNPTFYGLTIEAWMECVVLVPTGTGSLERLWVFPVDNRDEYMSYLENQGLTEYEGMDGVSVLREVTPTGVAQAWHLEWLPGNVAIFGSSREALAALRQIYAENSASRGLLAGAGGRFVEPDVQMRVFPPRLAVWQDNEPGQYWWRDRIELLTRDLIRYWQPNAARMRLVRTLADELVNWPRTLERVDLGVWFEQGGVEWRLRAAGVFAASRRGQLDIVRRLPERTALGYAVPMAPDSFIRFGDRIAGLVLGAAGGVMAQEVRRTGTELFALLRQARLREAAVAWVPPAPNRPELGTAKMLVMEWENADMVEQAWAMALAASEPDGLLSHAFSQLGIEISITPEEGDPFSYLLEVRRAGRKSAEPLYRGVFSYRRREGVIALVAGASRADAVERRNVMLYRSLLAAQAVENEGSGGAGARAALARMGPDGAGLLAFLDPVRFMQLALVEAADWRARSPDQEEPLSTQLAREMLGYGAGGTWTLCGEPTANVWEMNGDMPWRSLSRLSAALGVTESIGAE